MRCKGRVLGGSKRKTDMSVIDQATFNELKQMSGADFINELIDAFLDEAPMMIQNMHIALDTKDVESFRRNAHSLKSNANTFGATELGVLAKELEQMAKENNLEVGARLEILEEAFSKVSEELKGMRA
jgi:HPt (histidine-containing phosphotransfer) domain-containing protein